MPHSCMLSPPTTLKTQTTLTRSSSRIVAIPPTPLRCRRKTKASGLKYPDRCNSINVVCMSPRFKARKNPTWSDGKILSGTVADEDDEEDEEALRLRDRLRPVVLVDWPLSPRCRWANTCSLFFFRVATTASVRYRDVWISCNK